MGSHRVLGEKKTGGMGFLLFGRRVMVLRGRPNTCLDVSVNLGPLGT